MSTLIRSKSFIPLIMILVTVSFSCQKKTTGPEVRSNVPRALEVKGIVLFPRELNNQIYTTGTILANEEVEIRPEVPGRIISINFEEGTYVGKGELLVKINDTELQAQRKKLLLEEKLAKEDVYRKSKLLEIKAVSQEEFDISQNQLGVIQAEIELVSSQIEKTEIHAPFTGLIGLRSVSPGGYISSSMLIARMQQTDPVKIEFAIPEKYIGQIHKGTMIRFSIAGSDSLFSGTVYALEPRIELSTRSFTVRARCPNPANYLVPGAFAKINIVLQSIPDALVLPSEALIPDIAGEKVFLCRNGRVKTMYVKTGIRTESEVQVIEGLTSQDTVITSGLLQLKEDFPVKVRIP